MIGHRLSAPLFALLALWPTAIAAEEKPAAETVRIALPEFALTSSKGETVTRESLSGKPWIAGFLFTRCRGPCPRLAAGMARLERNLRPAGVRVAAFSVDPDHDTPEVLARYEASLGVGEGWISLTGEREGMYRLIREGFKLGVADASAVNPDHSVTHSTRLALVDGSGTIRGYFDSDDALAMDRLARDAAALAGGGLARALPALNASLNLVCAMLLVAGLAAIKTGRIAVHRRLMISAFCVSCAFLVSYITYHVLKGGVVTRFQGEGWIRPAYFGILVSHTILAAAVPVLAILTIRLGLRDERARHKRLARWTFPIWLYVSVTGVIIYWMLYHLHPNG